MSRSTKQPISSAACSLLCPSDLKPGTVAKFVHSRSAESLVGMVTERGSNYAIVRRMNEHGVPMLGRLEPIPNSKYLVKEVFE